MVASAIGTAGNVTEAAVFAFWSMPMHVMNTMPGCWWRFSHQGCRITDTEGRDYLDAVGYCRFSLANTQWLVAAIARLGRLIHTSNLHRIREQRFGRTNCRRVVGDAGGVLLHISAARPTRRRSSWPATTATKMGIENADHHCHGKAFHGRTMATCRPRRRNRKAQAGSSPWWRASCVPQRSAGDS